jgi:riboflavin kinase/FMN adenylyltransferase
VYAAWADLPDGRRLPAALNIGSRPTFDSAEPRIEAHILDPARREPAAGLPEYGWDLTLEFAGWVRDTVRFTGVDALKAQLARDCRVVLDLVGWRSDTVRTDVLKPAAIADGLREGRTVRA